MTTEAGRAYFEGVQRGYTAPIIRAAEAIPKIEAEAVAARNAEIAEAVRGLELIDKTDEPLADAVCSHVEGECGFRAAVLAIVERP